jgi:glucose/arabinose dehydrogenase
MFAASPARWIAVLVLIALATVATVAQQPPAPAAGQGGQRGGGRGAGAITLPPFPRAAQLPVPSAPTPVYSPTEQIRVAPVVTGLQNPWSLAFLPNGDMLITEKPGRLRIVRNGQLDATPISGTPAVVASGQGGMLDVAVHPRFAENQFVYITYSKPVEAGNTTALARGRLQGGALTDVKDIFVAEAVSKGSAHFGSRLVFARDGSLYMTVGERNERDRAQDTNQHAGKVLRLRDDGTVPPDNPFVNRPGHKPEVFSYGHRNPQGLTVHPETGAVWEVEHGPQGGDELNLILPGKNYGWPVVTFGREYSGPIINTPWKEGMEQPTIFWSPSPALSGMMFYTGDKFPRWKGQLFVGSLAGMALHRIGFTEPGPVGREALLTELRQRIRDVRQGPDGLIYLVTDANPGGVLRIEPAQ